MPRYPITHAELIARGPSYLCGAMVPASSDCDGQLARRLFKPNSCFLVCLKCGASLDLDRHWQTGRVVTQFSRHGEPMIEERREVIEVSATAHGPSANRPT